MFMGWGSIARAATSPTSLETRRFPTHDQGLIGAGIATTDAEPAAV